MSKIIHVIQKQKMLIHGVGASIEEIQCAEKALGVSFDKEYKEYLLTYGLIAFDGREFTG